MTEEVPFGKSGDLEPSRLQLRGPNVGSTFDLPLRADALRAQLAAIRKHLQDRRSGIDPTSGADAS